MNRAIDWRAEGVCVNKTINYKVKWTCVVKSIDPFTFRRNKKYEYLTREEEVDDVEEENACE